MYDLIDTSLPSFRFSSPPPRPIGTRKMVNLFNTLMPYKLGYNQYVAQDGYRGGALCSWLAWPPRSYAERLYNITHWSEMPKGGHFASIEQPQELIDDIRSFANQLF